MLLDTVINVLNVEKNKLCFALLLYFIMLAIHIHILPIGFHQVPPQGEFLRVEQRKIQQESSGKYQTWALQLDCMLGRTIYK